MSLSFRRASALGVIAFSLAVMAGAFVAPSAAGAGETTRIDVMGDESWDVGRRLVAHAYFDVSAGVELGTDATGITFVLPPLSEMSQLFGGLSQPLDGLLEPTPVLFWHLGDGGIPALSLGITMQDGQTELSVGLSESDVQKLSAGGSLTLTVE
ncbi:MAG: hypothetical protein LBH76_09065, partial [Propionibacteriaceae bacterium]|nr:hypothetical protein [Propionibacteriaceae bacterium]